MNGGKDQARWITLVVITAFAVYLSWKLLQPFINVLIWATVLVIVFYPVYRKIRNRTQRPSLSALISIVLVMLTVIIPLLLVTSAVANEIVHFTSNIQNYLQEIMSDPAKADKVKHWMDLIKQYVNVDQITSAGNLREYATKISQTVVKGTISVLGGALGFFVSVFFIVFTMYYLFRDGERFVAYLPEVLPLERHQSEFILSRSADIISASVFGVVVIAAIQGALGGIMLWILGIPSAVVWGVLMTLLCTIPMLGAFVVWIPAAIFLLLTGHWVKALILTLWGTLVIGMVDNFLRPKLVGQRTRMHELVVFFSVLGGLSVFGVLGILMGPVIIAITLTLLDVFHERDITSQS
jgi:predicted PurR-regulated permease PerM